MAGEGSTLAAALWPDRQETRLLRGAVLVLFGTLLLAVSAKVQIPMYPVPMTMQTFVVLLIGAAYGWRLGGLTLLAYLAEGFAMLPVFSGPVAGPGYFVPPSPTMGFIYGFVLAAVATGWMVEHGWGRPLWRLVVALAVGSVIPFVTGVAWLAALIGQDGPMGLERAVAVGLTPFILGAVVKLALAAAVITAGWQGVRGSGHDA